MLFEMGVNYHQLGQKVTEVYLKIFSLVDFKYELTLGFIRNYNRIEHFEESPF